jgi:hypothetical protein
MWNISDRRETKEYTVVFVPRLKDVEKVARLFDFLAKEDETFEYGQRSNFFSFNDLDKKRIYRRAKWLKERLATKGIEIFFSMFSHKRMESSVEDSAEE